MFKWRPFSLFINCNGRCFGKGPLKQLHTINTAKPFWSCLFSFLKGCNIKLKHIYCISCIYSINANNTELKVEGSTSSSSVLWFTVIYSVIRWSCRSALFSLMVPSFGSVVTLNKNICSIIAQRINFILFSQSDCQATCLCGYVLFTKVKFPTLSWFRNLKPCCFQLCFGSLRFHQLHSNRAKQPFIYPSLSFSVHSFAMLKI